MDLYFEYHNSGTSVKVTKIIDEGVNITAKDITDFTNTIIRVINSEIENNISAKVKDTESKNVKNMEFKNICSICGLTEHQLGTNVCYDPICPMNSTKSFTQGNLK